MMTCSEAGTKADKTLYVVSGFMRTGTSMMMRALESGGLPAAYQQSRDVMKNRHADEHYDPNFGGLYELEKRDYRERYFPLKYAGRLIKALNLGVSRMAVMPDGIKVVFMRRHPEEVRQSYMAFFEQNLRVNDFDRNMADAIQRIENRKDVLSLDVFWFREVIDFPLAHFEALRDRGWPIDAQAAAALVDPALCRYKIEDLTVGIV